MKPLLSKFLSNRSSFKSWQLKKYNKKKLCLANTETPSSNTKPRTKFPTLLSSKSSDPTPRRRKETFLLLKANRTTRVFWMLFFHQENGNMMENTTSSTSVTTKPVEKMSPPSRPILIRSYYLDKLEKLESAQSEKNSIVSVSTKSSGKPPPLFRKMSNLLLDRLQSIVQREVFYSWELETSLRWPFLLTRLCTKVQSPSVWESKFRLKRVRMSLRRESRFWKLESRNFLIRWVEFKWWNIDFFRKLSLRIKRRQFSWELMREERRRLEEEMRRFNFWNSRIPIWRNSIFRLLRNNGLVLSILSRFLVKF